MPVWSHLPCQSGVGAGAGLGGDPSANERQRLGRSRNCPGGEISGCSLSGHGFSAVPFVRRPIMVTVKP